MKIITGDCRQVVDSLGQFDCIVADPPYDCTPIQWDKQVKGWAPRMLRALKPSGSMWVFGSMRSLLASWEEFSGWKIAQDLVWEKHNGSGPVTQRRFNRVHEHVIQLYPIDAKWSEIYASQQRTEGHERKSTTRKVTGDNVGTFRTSAYDSTSRVVRSVVQYRSCHGSAVHPTQKPVELLRLLLRYSCPPGGRVLDPFAGSGSTLKAAKEEGMEAIGIDIRGAV